MMKESAQATHKVATDFARCNVCLADVADVQLEALWGPSKRNHFLFISRALASETIPMICYKSGTLCCSASFEFNGKRWDTGRCQCLCHPRGGFQWLFEAASCIAFFFWHCQNVKVILLLGLLRQETGQFGFGKRLVAVAASCFYARKWFVGRSFFFGIFGQFGSSFPDSELWNIIVTKSKRWLLWRNLLQLVDNNNNNNNNKSLVSGLSVLPVRCDSRKWCVLAALCVWLTLLWLMEPGIVSTGTTVVGWICIVSELHFFLWKPWSHLCFGHSEEVCLAAWWSRWMPSCWVPREETVLENWVTNWVALEPAFLPRVMRLFNWLKCCCIQILNFCCVFPVNTFPALLHLTLRDDVVLATNTSSTVWLAVAGWECEVHGSAPAVSQLDVDIHAKFLLG